VAELLFTDIIDKLNKRLGPGTVKRASTINRPRPKREVQQIKIFNEFNRRNPKADGGPIDDYKHYVLKSELSERVIQLMDEEGFEFGEAVKQAMKEGYKDGGRVRMYAGGSLEPYLAEIKTKWLSGQSAQQIFESNPTKYEENQL